MVNALQKRFKMLSMGINRMSLDLIKLALSQNRVSKTNMLIDIFLVILGMIKSNIEEFDLNITQLF